MSTFLLEIGTEELPADFARLAIPQLLQLVQAELKEHRLGHGAIHCTSSPRRLAVWVEELELQGPERIEERKGPPANQAFSNGVPTEAALGFARRCGLGADALELRETAKGPFVFAKVVEPGSSSELVLIRAIPLWIAALQGKRFMRWGSGDNRFSRPVRWLVAMLDTQILDVVLEGSDPVVKAGNRSRGHRLFSQEVLIEKASDYQQQLAAAGIVVNRADRAALIKNAVSEAASSLQARPDLPNELLEELTDLVEAPLLIKGLVPNHFLKLPAELLSTVMRSHQRYIPLYFKDIELDPLDLNANNYLLPTFLCISNALQSAVSQVQHGNEKVLKARLADAEFFINADCSTTCSERRNQLARVSFADGLGSLLNRTERLEWCVGQLTQLIKNISKPDAEHAQRAAHFCKNDLVSQIVGEFPELQGLMGSKYLFKEGESKNVALAVYEHYLPKGADDELPKTTAGTILALAERLELLLSIYAKGERPSGSSDPYGLRRAGNGILLLLWNKGWCLDLIEMLKIFSINWQKLFPALEIQSECLAKDLSEFFKQRLLSMLADQGCPVDIAQAVAGVNVSNEQLLRDPADAKIRSELLIKMRNNGSLLPLQQVVQRAAKLAVKAELGPLAISPKSVVDCNLFQATSEKEMFIVLEKLERLCLRGPEFYPELAEMLTSSSNILAEFFDGDNSVMVMVDNLELRKNRLNMLAVLKNQSNILADFSSLNG
ncbi:glycine--tRNA ligase subunit beta [Synechococcus sp. UW140]|uniref:glycine--tRNA ligase subunit beta n=1 Tax=Synechococcus sp. UW140 TaxID=368503 RepID=UPI003137B04E